MLDLLDWELQSALTVYEDETSSGGVCLEA